ncbi:uncharacterized protein LOC21397882 isoform X2 [Morus notabilis]|uniref:uncharacterized protein LOC21397882 isoform X2 n=1 Tax=Morus notabilis TaxID=981085 RepID=UPI000CED4B44|nr:uncharacterized protein LOC21397882 isoform X2 [Morus notabilis]
MDFDEWEFIPADGFLDFCEDGVKKKIHYSNWGSDPKGVFDMNYFDCPLQDSRKTTTRRENPRPPSQLVPVPIIPVHLNPTVGKSSLADDHDQLEKEITDEAGEADQDSVSQVFFKKMKKENEFVDTMKVDSPKSPTTTSRGFMPQIDASTFEFDEDKEEGLRSKEGTKSLEGENSCDDDGLSIWKLGLTGIGAICSFGVAAATICVLFFGSHQKNQQSSHKIRFQLYNDDKV